MMAMPDCIIAAAGRSRRMGKWKPGLRWGAGPMVLKVVQEARSAGCRVIVVGGYKYRRMRRMTAHLNGVSFVRARGWKRGMDESLRSALPFVKSEWFFVVPADMPRIRSGDYRKLQDLIDSSADSDVIRPVVEDSPGHPVLFRSSLIPTLLHAEPGRPFRDSLPHGRTRRVAWSHHGVTTDIDSPDDYRRFKIPDESNFR